MTVGHSEPPLLAVHDLSRRAPNSGRCLLQNVGFTIPQSDRLGLAGPSGSGKSTLLRMLALLDPPDTGDIRYRGSVLSGDSIPPFRRQVVYLAQRPVFQRGTVADNLRLAFSFKSAARCDWDIDRAESLIGQLAPEGLDLNQQADSLSGGEKQIAALVRALVLSPRILLFDEPTSALDEDATLRFEQVVNDWFDGDGHGARALVWVSHDVAQTSRMTNRLARLNAGNVVFEDRDAY